MQCPVMKQCLVQYEHCYKANCMLLIAIINKFFEHLNTNMLPQLYNFFVCPKLEYGNIIWWPQSILDQKSVKKIQRTATKLIREIKDLLYFVRLTIRYQRGFDLYLQIIT